MPLSLAKKILAFDTSSPRGSVALLQGTELFAELKLRSLQTHSANLLRSVDFLLGRLDWTLNDLDLVAVGIGPGSFTGIRIGVSTALGIAQSLSISFAGISGLEALAYQSAYLNGRIGVLLNAQRSQAFYAEYVGKNGRLRLSQKPSLLFVSDLERRLKDRHLYIVGDWNTCLAGEWKGSKTGWPRPIEADLYLAASIGRRALAAKRRWRSGICIECDPLYIRPPDALREKSGTR